MQATGTKQTSGSRGLGPTLALLLLAALIGIGTTVAGALAVLPVFGLLLIVWIVARPEYGIALFLSTFLMNYPKALQGTGFLTINNVLGGIFLVLLAYEVYREEDWWFLRAPEVQILVFIVFAFYLSGRFHAPDSAKLSLLGVQVTTAANLRTFINRVAFVVFFINFIRAPEHIRMIYVLALAFMVVTALTGIQSVLQGGGLYGQRATARVILAAVNPNRLAMFAILAIAGLWYLAQSLQPVALRFVIIPTIVVLALAVFMTASRGGLLGLGVCALVILIDQRASLTIIFNLALAGVLLMMLVLRFVPAKSLERITNLPGTQAGRTGEGAGSLQRRQYAWRIAIDMARESPFLGVGMGNWEVARFLRDPTRSTGAPHSSYLLALVEGGAFCLTGFLVLLWRTWRNLRISEDYLSDPAFPLADLLWIVKSAKVSLVVLVFFSIFADLWQLVILFWLVGLGIVIRRMVERTALEEIVAY
ncbi:MAG: O-antigen ligase family protein [Candidatus Binatia bacterium]